MSKQALKSEFGAVASLKDVLPSVGDKWHGATVPEQHALDKIKMHRWNILVRQLGIKDKVGSLYMPDSVKDAQSYTHGMAVVVRVGPSVYRGRKYEDLGLTPEDGPKVGDIVVFKAATAPLRVYCQGIELLTLTDDTPYMSVEPDGVQYISFKL